METPKLGNLNKEQLAALLAEKRKEICRLEQELLREIDEESKEKDDAAPKSEGKDGETVAEAKKPSGEKPCAKDENKNESNKGDGEKVDAAKAKGSANGEEENDEYDIWKPPTWCIPIRADVRNFDFKKLAETQKKLTGKTYISTLARLTVHRSFV